MQCSSTRIYRDVFSYANLSCYVSYLFDLFVFWRPIHVDPRKERNPAFLCGSKAMTEYIAEVEAQTEKFGITPPWGTRGPPGPPAMAIDSLYTPVAARSCGGPIRKAESKDLDPTVSDGCGRTFCAAPGPFYLAPCYPGTGPGLSLESSDSGGEKDHDGPFGGCPRWIFAHSQHDNMQIKWNSRLVNNPYPVLCPVEKRCFVHVSRHLLAHWMLHMSFYTQRRSDEKAALRDDSFPLNQKSLPPMTPIHKQITYDQVLFW